MCERTDKLLQLPNFACWLLLSNGNMVPWRPWRISKLKLCLICTYISNIQYESWPHAQKSLLDPNLHPTGSQSIWTTIANLLPFFPMSTPCTNDIHLQIRLLRYWTWQILKIPLTASQLGMHSHYRGEGVTARSSLLAALILLIYLYLFSLLWLPLSPLRKESEWK